MSDDDDKFDIESATILRVRVGSNLHGTALEGTDDNDEMGVCIEPAKYVIGLEKFEQFQYRSQPEGVRSGPGDLDLTIYSLRKYCRLACNGNPTILTLLYAPQSHIIKETYWGTRLRDLAPHFRSRRAATAFRGYMREQKERLQGTRGNKKVTRTELIEVHGYDTKYAGHVIRLGVQGAEYIKEGILTLPMQGYWRDMILSIRRGEVSLDDVLSMASELEIELDEAIDSGDYLPKQVDHYIINEFLIEAYNDRWDYCD